MDGEPMVVDELSPDSMRLWKKGTQQSMDKDLFRKDTGDIIEAYKKILLDLQGGY
jgi:phosphoribosylaminoimidazole-succinocarboxamide synthase